MKTENRKAIRTTLIHVAAWSLLYTFPFLIFGKVNDADLLEKLIRFSIVIFAFLTVFYVNYFILIERLMFRKKLWQFVVSEGLLILTVASALYIWNAANPQAPDPSKPAHIHSAVVFLLRDVLSLLITFGVSLAVKTTSKWYQMEIEYQEAENKRTEAELTNLRQQLNPHFLFNTLNNIYSLIAISPDKAQNTVHELSKLLRYALYENNHNFVPLEHEVDFIKNYVELMRIRLTPDIEVNINIDIPTTNKQLVAPMLFISLVENSFKHGISPSQPSFIEIHIYQKENQLFCTTRNSYFPKSATDQSGSGIGLENLRRRLELIYPSQHTLTAQKEDNTFVSQLIIPLNAPQP